MTVFTKVTPDELSECAAWPGMPWAAALRFWLSRLTDFFLPRAGELTHLRDPEHLRRILESRQAHAPAPAPD